MLLMRLLTILEAPRRWVMESLSQAFLAHVDDPAVFSGVAAATLDAGLAALVEDARRVWPAFTLAPHRFVRFLAERLPPGVDPLARLASLRAPDLYLACAAADGVAPA